MDPKGKQELRRLRCIKKAKLNLYVRVQEKKNDPSLSYTDLEIVLSWLFMYF